MPKRSNVAEIDLEHILCHIFETMTVYEYPTASVFSGVTRLSIVSFLRGRGVQNNIEDVAIDIFKQLNEFSEKDKNYEWFNAWGRKLAATLKERKVRS